MKTLTYSLLLFVFLATAGLGWLFDFFYEQEKHTHRDLDKVNLVEKMGMQLAFTLNTLSEKERFITQWQQPLANNIDGSPIYDKGTFQLEVIKVDELPMPQALLSQIRRGEPLLLETREHLSWHFYLPELDDILLLKAPIMYFSQQEQSREYFFTIAFYFSLLALLLLWAYPLVKQLHALRKTAQLFGDGQLNQRVASANISYIRDIEDDFNRMAQRIEGLVSDVKLLSSAVSHELRTPLARIRFGLDTLEEENDPILRTKYQEKISKHVDDMTALVETLLAYARLDQAMISLKPEPINLVELVTKLVKKHGDENTAIKIQAVRSSYVVAADKSYLTTMFNNLLCNAIKYGRGEVIVVLDSNYQEVTIQIHDNGLGIPPTERNEIIKPFNRGKQSSAGVGGHGIGLAIVKRVLDWHHGTLNISDSSVLSGACFTIKLSQHDTAKL